MHIGDQCAFGRLYGPVLTQIELYLLNPLVEIHPVLTNSMSSFRLIFNILSGMESSSNYPTMGIGQPSDPQAGQIGGYSDANPNVDLPFLSKDEPATFPKMTDLYIIFPYTPWCTRVHNSRGVTMRDICVALWIEYSQTPITTEEYSLLSPIMKVAVQRTALLREYGTHAAWSDRKWTSGLPVNRMRRIDWLRENIFFDRLERNDDFAIKRLGYAAPNIFVLHVIS